VRESDRRESSGRLLVCSSARLLSSGLHPRHASRGKGCGPSKRSKFQPWSHQSHVQDRFMKLPFSPCCTAKIMPANDSCVEPRFTYSTVASCDSMRMRRQHVVSRDWSMSPAGAPCWGILQRRLMLCRYILIDETLVSRGWPMSPAGAPSLGESSGGDA